MSDPIVLDPALLAVWREDKISVETLVASIRGWCNHVRYGNTVGLQKAILRRLPTEIVELLNF